MGHIFTNWKELDSVLTKFIHQNLSTIKLDGNHYLDDTKIKIIDTLNLIFNSYCKNGEYDDFFQIS